mmetsp:Transcript_42812/g.128513  ORF Transcript_42812/g.128513 Transcript_42812/m.128513 type:complete len:228 (-) Transcript_42812:57-740(-)
MLLLSWPSCRTILRYHLVVPSCGPSRGAVAKLGCGSANARRVGVLTLRGRRREGTWRAGARARSVLLDRCALERDADVGPALLRHVDWQVRLQVRQPSPRHAERMLNLGLVSEGPSVAELLLDAVDDAVALPAGEVPCCGQDVAVEAQHGLPALQRAHHAASCGSARQQRAAAAAAAPALVPCECGNDPWIVRDCRCVVLEAAPAAVDSCSGHADVAAIRTASAGGQ